MKPILYKVETYIVPEVENLLAIDDLKIAKQLKIESESVSRNNTQNEKNALFASYNKCEEFARFSAESSKLIGIKIVKSITNENETPLDEHYDSDIVKYYNDNSYSNERLCVQKKEFQVSIGPQEALYPARQFSRVNSLTSIDEKSENSLDTKLNDFCHHGYKNGCTASIPSPEEVSEEIFRENWLQKIEVLRDRETMLREKEINLQKRERELFRKEKELRIMERILNDKMKQVDQQLKYKKDMQLGQMLEEAARILSDIEKTDSLSKEKIPKKDVTKKEDISKKEEIPKKKEIPRQVSEEAARILFDIERSDSLLSKEKIQKKDVMKKEDISKKEDIRKREEVPRKAEIPQKPEIPKKIEIPKNPQSSMINLYEKNEESNKKIIHPSRSNSSSRKSSFSRTHSRAIIKHKERPVNYDDLNSTLSAASVDSPRKRTSEWFNPALYKKPHAFTRSASERWARHKGSVGKLQKVIEEKPNHVIEEDKIFRKVSDNICALQEKETKFQNYGLVDCIPGGVSSRKTEGNSDKDYTNSEEKLSSYLDIEIGERRSHRRRSRRSVSKDHRPVSWTNEMNERLQKRHQVHESTTKQSGENKENVTSAETILTKSTKSKRFFLFR